MEIKREKDDLCCVGMAACPVPHSGCVTGDSPCPQDFNVSSEKANSNSRSGEPVIPMQELHGLLGC